MSLHFLLVDKGDKSGRCGQSGQSGRHMRLAELRHLIKENLSAKFCPRCRGGDGFSEVLGINRMILKAAISPSRSGFACVADGAYPPAPYSTINRWESSATERQAGNS